MTKTRLFAVALLLLIHLHYCRSLRHGGSSYQRLAFNATEFPAEEEYDYIIVGGGTAGCPMAATLSSHFRVLLLERGGSPQTYPNLMTVEGFLMTLAQTDQYDSPAQAFTSEEGVPNARGRVLGGSSSINAGFYSRADAGFFEHAGPIKWDMNLVNQSYEWVEKAVVFRPDLRRWQSAFRDGLLEANITPYNGFTVEHLPGTKIGGTLFDRSGGRHTAADLLRYANSENIRVALHATVERVLLSSVQGRGSGSRDDLIKTTAIGVIYTDGAGQHHHAMVRSTGEVILSAGALGSPQLLLLSGVGPRPYLSSWGIPVAHHSPYVGQYLRDNPRNGISILSPIPLGHSLIQVVGITDSGSYIEAASNVLPFISPAAPSFARTRSGTTLVTVATLMEKVAGPQSSGSLRLASTDVRDNPLVRFNYFSEPVDLARCMRGARKVGELLRGRSMDDFRFLDRIGLGGMGGMVRNFRYVGASLPANLDDNLAMAEYCRRTVTTIWHYHGGCVVGKVVDGDFRVMDIGALRVVDGSTFSVSPGTNPQATLMMLGRYVGLKIIMERRRSD